MSRATTASSAKNQAVAVLTTTIPSTETIMASTTLTLPAEMASPAAALSLGSAHDVILALDLGTVTGFAIARADGGITSGTAEFRLDRWQSGGMRFLRFKRWLTELKNQAGGCDLVVYEQVRRHAGVDSAHAFGGWLAILTAWCDHHDIAYQGVPVGTIKRHITGKGNADKQAVIDAIRARGFYPADDNEADALAILLWAIETHGGVR
jgi:Holliday junction resolvasome RuvABC endonuclease subunit